MTTTAHILNTVNEFRARDNMPPIKSWKGKKEALLAMLDELQAKHKPKMRKSGALAAYCREHGINAKTMRHKLRTAGMPRTLENLLTLLEAK